MLTKTHHSLPLDVKDGRVVKGVSFVNLRDAGDPVKWRPFTTMKARMNCTSLDITRLTKTVKPLWAEQTATGYSCRSRWDSGDAHAR